MTTTTPPAATEPRWSDNDIWMALVGMLKPNNMLDVHDTDSVVRRMRDSYQAELDRARMALAAAKAGTWQPLPPGWHEHNQGSVHVDEAGRLGFTWRMSLRELVYDGLPIEQLDVRLCRLVEVDATPPVPVDDIESVIVRYLFAVERDDERLNRVRAWLDKVKPVGTDAATSAKEQGDAPQPATLENAPAHLTYDDMLSNDLDREFGIEFEDDTPLQSP